MTRRSWLRQAGRWLLGLSVFYPFYTFVVAERVRPPKEVRVRGRLKPGKFLADPEFVLFETETGPLAVSRRCTHLGCLVNYREADRVFLCPCHQSHFARDGRYLAGPAKKDLTRLEVLVMDADEGYLIHVPRGA